MSDIPFRASDATRDGFAALVDGLRSLRDRGLVRLDEGRIMTSERGGYLLAGPCDLTEAGRQALTRDRRLGPRRRAGAAIARCPHAAGRLRALVPTDHCSGDSVR